MRIVFFSAVFVVKRSRWFTYRELQEKKQLSGYPGMAEQPFSKRPGPGNRFRGRNTMLYTSGPAQEDENDQTVR